MSASPRHASPRSWRRRCSWSRPDPRRSSPRTAVTRSARASRRRRWSPTRSPSTSRSRGSRGSEPSSPTTPGDRRSAPRWRTPFADVEGVELQIEVAPVPEQDFTTYLRNLEEFEPDILVATGHPPGSGAITVQSADLGLDIPVTGRLLAAGRRGRWGGRRGDRSLLRLRLRRLRQRGVRRPRPALLAILRQHVHGGRRRRRIRHRADGRPGRRGGRRRPGRHRRVPAQRDVRPSRRTRTT